MDNVMTQTKCFRALQGVHLARRVGENLEGLQAAGCDAMARVKRVVERLGF
jgi:hypothetical protein